MSGRLAIHFADISELHVKQLERILRETQAHTAATTQTVAAAAKRTVYVQQFVLQLFLSLKIRYAPAV